MAKIQEIELVEYMPGKFRLHGFILNIRFDISGDNPEDLMRTFIDAMNNRLEKDDSSLPSS